MSTSMNPDEEWMRRFASSKTDSNAKPPKHVHALVHKKQEAP